MNERSSFCRSHVTFLSTLVSLLLVLGSSSAQANLLDNENDLTQAVQALRSAIGSHPRVLRIEVQPNALTIEAQDPNNHNHVNQWRCSVGNLAFIPIRSVTGPVAVELNLVNPDLEANLFDLDSLVFSATKKLEKTAIEQAHLQDAATVERMEIERQTYILPKPNSGDVRWTLYVTSGRESAEVYANAQGIITSADLSGTERAKNLDLFKQPELAADAAAAFGSVVGTNPVLTSVRIYEGYVFFVTNIPDNRLGKHGGPVVDVANYSWNLEGLKQNLPLPEVPSSIEPAKTPFSVNDVDWTIPAKLKADALAKVSPSPAQISAIELAKSSSKPGAPVLTWTFTIKDSNGEETSVTADAQKKSDAEKQDTKSAITGVELPKSRRSEGISMDPVTLGAIISQIGKVFSLDTKIEQIMFTDRGGSITIDDPANGGKPATFDLSTEGATRAITVSLPYKAPRFSVADLAPLTQEKVTALVANTMKKLGQGKKVYLQSFTVGSTLFVPEAGARAIEVRVRDLPQDTHGSKSGWIVYDFSGHALYVVNL